MGRSRTTHPGRGLTEREDRFVRLIAQGVPNAEASRIVGINRRTGTRWRFGRTILNTAGEPVHYPPVYSTPAPRSRHPRYLSLAERTVIADLHREHRPVREIAAVLGRSPSTVSRELRRNAAAGGRYLPATAEALAAARVARPRQRRLLTDAQLRQVVMELLGQRWSPEQVAHELCERFPDQPERQLSTETTLLCVSSGDHRVCRGGGESMLAVSAR
jgi:transposase, IS30 family